MAYNFKIFKELKKLALTSDHRNAKIAAALLKRGKVIAYGINRMKSHPFQKKHGRTEDCIFLHAEISAILTALREYQPEDLEGMDMYIARVKRGADKKTLVSGLAMPCTGCQEALNSYGIRKVVYTTDQEQSYSELICRPV